MTQLVEYKGGGFVTVTETPECKQMSAESVQALVYEVMRENYTLLTVNNGTSSRKINPRMREHAPDNRVYTLQVTKAFNRQNKKS